MRRHMPISCWNRPSNSLQHHHKPSYNNRCTLCQYPSDHIHIPEATISLLIRPCTTSDFQSPSSGLVLPGSKLLPSFTFTLVEATSLSTRRDQSCSFSQLPLAKRTHQIYHISRHNVYKTTVTCCLRGKHSLRYAIDAIILQPGNH